MVGQIKRVLDGKMTGIRHQVRVAQFPPADFIISSMQLPEVDVATWHALGVKGPWQLFHYDSKNDDVYPSAVYWAFRVVRDAMLKDISITPPY